MFGQTILYLYHVTTAVTADIYHVNGTKHGSDLSIVGSYVTFSPCKLFITMTVIILCNTFRRKNAMIFYYRP